LSAESLRDECNAHRAVAFLSAIIRLWYKSRSLIAAATNSSPDHGGPRRVGTQVAEHEGWYIDAGAILHASAYAAAAKLINKYPGSSR
jgi:hypothetical protein